MKKLTNMNSNVYDIAYQYRGAGYIELELVARCLTTGFESSRRLVLYDYLDAFGYRDYKVVAVKRTKRGVKIRGYKEFSL